MSSKEHNFDREVKTKGVIHIMTCNDQDYLVLCNDRRVCYITIVSPVDRPFLWEISQSGPDRLLPQCIGATTPLRAYNLHALREELVFTSEWMTSPSLFEILLWDTFGCIIIFMLCHLYMPYCAVLCCWTLIRLLRHYAGDIGAIEIWLTDWLIPLGNCIYCNRGVGLSMNPLYWFHVVIYYSVFSARKFYLIHDAKQWYRHAITVMWHPRGCLQSSHPRNWDSYCHL